MTISKCYLYTRMFNTHPCGIKTLRVLSTHTIRPTRDRGRNNLIFPVKRLHVKLTQFACYNRISMVFFFLTFSDRVISTSRPVFFFFYHTLDWLWRIKRVLKTAICFMITRTVYRVLDCSMYATLEITKSISMHNVTHVLSLYAIVN